MITLIDEKIDINGRDIHYKVVSSSHAPHTRPFLLCIQGGPGFSSLSMELALADFEKQAKAANLPMPNVIFVDPVGCGLSDKANDIEAEYSVHNFSEIHARVIEHVKNKFSPNDTMDLRIFGGSFGGMAVMDLPVHRPQWLEDDSDIRLRQIIANVTPNGVGDREYSLKFVEDNFKEHPDYAEIMLYLNKLLDGEIKDQAEYLRFAFALAPLYSDELAKTKNGFLGRLLMNHTQGTIGALKLVNKVIGSRSISFMIEGMTGCTLDVLNQFCKGDHNNFDLTQQVKENVELYAKVPICMIACNRDHMVDANTSLNISKLLPGTCAAVILNDKHQSRRGPTKEVFNGVLLGLICRSSIPMQML